mmetsp:Transcript_87863/g.253711  ORF Transcript_87863/g.253711 Transcript_87863/m.253711 type:complete len:492 (-) Transcript_87863:1085-2560(-)
MCRRRRQGAHAATAASLLGQQGHALGVGKAALVLVGGVALRQLVGVSARPATMRRGCRSEPRGRPPLRLRVLLLRAVGRPLPMLVARSCGRPGKHVRQTAEVGRNAAGELDEAPRVSTLRGHGRVGAHEAEDRGLVHARNDNGPRHAACAHRGHRRGEGRGCGYAGSLACGDLVPPERPVRPAQHELRRICRAEALERMVHNLEAAARSTHHPLMGAEDDAAGRTTRQQIRDGVLEVLLLDDVVAIVDQQKDPTARRRALALPNLAELLEPRQVRRQAVQRRSHGGLVRDGVEAWLCRLGRKPARRRLRKPSPHAPRTPADGAAASGAAAAHLLAAVADRPQHRRADVGNPTDGGQRAANAGIGACAWRRRRLQPRCNTDATDVKRKGTVNGVQHRRLADAPVLALLRADYDRAARSQVLEHDPCVERPPTEVLRKRRRGDNERGAEGPEDRAGPLRCGGARARGLSALGPGAAYAAGGGRSRCGAQRRLH